MTQSCTTATNGVLHSPLLQNGHARVTTLPVCSRDTSLFINRELSWLRFNDRVLHMACDSQVPLLERVNFFSIFSSNLDEFFMKRIGGLRRRIASGVEVASIDGLSPAEQLQAIRTLLLPMIDQSERVYHNEIRPQLKSAGIELLAWHELKESEKSFATQYFKKNIFPILTPLAVDAGHPFPFLSNLSMSLGVSLRSSQNKDLLFARVKVSGVHPKWLLLDTPGTVASCDRYRFISIFDIIENNLADLFPDMEIVAAMPFRITRNADLDIDEEENEDLLTLIEENLKQRKFAKVVRLEHGAQPDPWILSFICDALQLQQDDIYEHEALVDFSALSEICQLPLSHLKYPAFTPITPEAFQQEDLLIFDVLKKKEVLVHHPFESFSKSVERFVAEAALDPAVVSIKMTVYRVGDKTPIIPLLIQAAENGKHVVCVVELKARFEEERNMQWAQMLEDAGVHVVYGIPRLKIHAKTILVIREESDGLQCYAHIATGNYHVKTATLYTDVGFFTKEKRYTDELIHLFNFITGRSEKKDYSQLLVSPLNMESRITDLIYQEKQNHLDGKPARIIAKMNSLEDQHVIEALYEASKAGVPIDLIVRGICCLRPGIPGVSDTIRVTSIVGRLLEHSRILYFQNGAANPNEGHYLIGSACWMSRNLHRRVELTTFIEAEDQRAKLWNILQAGLNDKRQAWRMCSNGNYVKLRSESAQQNLSSQDYLLQQASGLSKKQISHL